MKFADDNDLVIFLVVGMYGRYDEKMLDNAALEQFYYKFGFEILDRRPVRMVRRPSREKHTP